jgi:hypothetical protein
VSSAQSTLVGPISEEWVVAGTIPAGAAAGAIVPATIQRQATTAAQNQVSCPGKEVWDIEREYFVGTNPTPDAALVILVDLTPQRYQPLASSINLALNKPAALSNAIRVGNNSNVTAQLVASAANALTVGVDIAFKVQVKQTPLSV